MWKNLLKDVKDEIDSLKNLTVDLKMEASAHTYIMLDIIYYMMCNYPDYIDDSHTPLMYRNICSDIYNYFSNDAEFNNQKNCLRFRKMSLFCKGCYFFRW